MAKKGELRYTKAQVADALTAAHGSRVGAARALGCSTVTVWQYMQRYPALQEVVRHEDEATTDKAIECIRDMIYQGGNLGACAFWLKTRAGWSERAQVELSGNLAHTVRHDPPPRAQTLEEWCADRRRQVQEALDA